MFKLPITEDTGQTYEYWEYRGVKQRGPEQDLMVAFDLYKDNAAKDDGAKLLQKTVCIEESDVNTMPAFLAGLETAIRLKDDLNCDGKTIDFTAAVNA